MPILLVSQGLINVGLGTFGVLYNLYLAVIGQSLAFIGTFNAVSVLALGVSAVPIGAGARLLSHRRAMQLGTVLVVVVQVALALGKEPSLLLGAGVVWGVAQALCLVPVGPVIVESVPSDQRAAVFGRLYAAWALATVIGSVLGGILPGTLAALFDVGAADSVGAYRAALLLTTAITLFAAPLLALPMPGQVEPEVRAQVDAPGRRGWALGSVRGTLTAVVVTIGLYSLAGGLVAPFFNVYFAQQLKLPTTLIGALFALAALLSVPGSLFGPRLSRRLGPVSAVVLVRAAIVPCLLGLALGSVAPLLAMAGFLLRFALIFISGALDSHFTLSIVPSKTRPLAAGLRTGTYNLCWALGAWGAGNLIDRVGYPGMFLASAAITGLASLLFLVLFGLPMRQ